MCKAARIKVQNMFGVGKTYNMSGIVNNHCQNDLLRKTYVVSVNRCVIGIGFVLKNTSSVKIRERKLETCLLVQTSLV